MASEFGTVINILTVGCETRVLGTGSDLHPHVPQLQRKTPDAPTKALTPHCGQGRKRGPPISERSSYSNCTQNLLGGSGVVMSRVLSPLIWVISIVTLLITRLITTQEPPSRV